MRNGEYTETGFGRKKYSLWFIWLNAIFITSLIVANILAVKLVAVSSFIFPAGIIVFPITYILGDVLTEVYGYAEVKKVIWLGFFCNLITVAAIWIGGILPPASIWDGQQAYDRILGFTARLLCASFLAYLVGEFANSFVLSRIKLATHGRWLWLRTIGSTIVGQGLDSVIFLTIAFVGTVSLPNLFSLITMQWISKTVYEIAATPLTYIVIGFLKNEEDRTQ